MHIKRLSLFICFIVTLSLFFISETIAATLQDAEDAIANKKYPLAIIYLKNELKQNPQNAQARYLLGDTYLKTGKINFSIKELSRAYDYAPDNSKIIFRYADALQAAGKHKKTMELLKNNHFQAKEQESQRLSHLGFTHLRLKQLADAQQVFNDANQLQESAMAYNGLAGLAMIEHELEKAAQLLYKSLTIDAQNQETLKLKAKLATLNKHHQLALLLYNDLIKENTIDAALRMERANTLFLLKKDTLAKKDIYFVLKKAKNSPRANFLLAQILLRETNFTGAQEAAQKVVNDTPGHMPANLILGAANFALQNYNQAEEYVTIYLLARPSDLKAQNLLANIYLAQNKVTQTLLILEGIPEKQRQTSPIILFTLANAYIKKGETKKGIELLNHAQSLAPNNLKIKKRLITIRYQLGEIDTAITELERISNSEQAHNQTDFLLILSYIKQQQFEKARKKNQQLLAQSPDDLKLQNMNALIEQLKGQTDKARLLYLEIINNNKNDISAYLGLARLYAIESKWQDSEKYFKLALSLNPKEFRAYQGLIAISERQNKHELAERYFLDAIAQNKNDIAEQLKIATLLSQWYLKNNQEKKILSLVQTIEKQHPDNDSIRFILAKAQLLNQKGREGERTLRRIIQYDKLDLDSRILLAETIAEDPQRIDEAMDLFEEAQAIAPDNPVPYVRQVILLIKLKQYTSAITRAQHIQLFFPGTLMGQQLEADALYAQKEYRMALALYQKIYLQKPDNTILLSIISLFQILKQDYNAIKILSKAIELNPENTENIYKLAVLHHKYDNLEQAETYYLQTLEHAPNHILALNNLAWIHYQNNIRRALSWSKKAYELAPHSSAIMDTYGYFLVRSGQHNKGLELLQKVAKARPNDKDIQYHLAYAYKEIGQRDRALAILKTLVHSRIPFSEQEEASALYQSLNLE